MQYHSTRGLSPEIDSAQAVLNGLAPDGGLYLPLELPAFSWKNCIEKVEYYYILPVCLTKMG
jgi:threonine synthase